MTDPLFLVGVLLLGMALGTILTTIRFKNAAARIVGEEIDKQNPVRTADVLLFTNRNDKREPAKTRAL